VSDALGFLSPTHAAVELRTPMDALHPDVELRDDWRIGAYPDRDGPVWVADASPIGKTELRASEDEIAAATGGLPLGATRREPPVRVARLTPTRALLLGPVADHELGLDLTCAWAAVRLGGERVRDLFARISALDARPSRFPVDGVMMGSVARCPGIVVAEAPDRLLVLVGWEYGAYLWETVLDAGAPLGLAPATFDGGAL
jgi:hypothetical protein